MPAMPRRLARYCPPACHVPKTGLEILLDWSRWSASCSAAQQRVPLTVLGRPVPVVGCNVHRPHESLNTGA